MQGQAFEYRDSVRSPALGMTNAQFLKSESFIGD